jgi:hypothetical protein
MQVAKRVRIYFYITFGNNIGRHNLSSILAPNLRAYSRVLEMNKLRSSYLAIHLRYE